MFLPLPHFPDFFPYGEIVIRSIDRRTEPAQVDRLHIHICIGLIYLDILYFGQKQMCPLQLYNFCHAALVSLVTLVDYGNFQPLS